MDRQQRRKPHLSLVHIQLRVHDIIEFLEENAAHLPSLPDVADADMALMYLRHLERHLNSA